EHAYEAFQTMPVQIRIGAFEIAKPLLLWINDGLMAIFFLLVGLEVKREMLEGALSSRVQATFPAIAAVGGMLAPALIYSFFNYGDEATRAGWAIPAATDIAFAL
ncbi:Na+/H+ antiporter NhaA, partial [Streptococcus uberis]|uniref:Na+/H+ antiporter NhaA n=1 Tax=Streptococcus uberis TaxID=1349 RepID=UPI003D6BE626